MSQNLSFPGLGLEFNLNPVAFKLPSFLGGLEVYWYGVLIAIAFLAALAYILSRSDTFGLDSDKVFNVIFVAIILGVLGARAYYVLFSWDTFKNDLISIFNFRQGGLAIYGGIILGAIGVIIGCRIWKVKLLPMLDLAVGGVIIGQAIGRWGNFVNIEAFGSNTTLPWGMTSPSIVAYLSAHQASLGTVGVNIDPSMPVHPTFLYESLWCLAGFLIIAIFTNKRRFDGQITLIYFAWYGLGRFFIEGLRTDSLMLGNIRVSQRLALAAFIASFMALYMIGGRIHNRKSDEYLMIYANTEESKLIVAGKAPLQEAVITEKELEPEQEEQEEPEQEEQEEPEQEEPEREEPENK